MSWLYVLIDKTQLLKKCRESMYTTGFLRIVFSYHICIIGCVLIMFSACRTAKQMDDVEIF